MTRKKLFFSVGKIAGVTQGHCTRLPWLYLGNNCCFVGFLIYVITKHFSKFPGSECDMKKTHAMYEDTSELRVSEFVHFTSYSFTCLFRLLWILVSFTQASLTLASHTHFNSIPTHSPARTEVGSGNSNGNLVPSWLKAFGNFVQPLDKDLHLPGPVWLVPGLLFCSPVCHTFLSLGVLQLHRDSSHSL